MRTTEFINTLVADHAAMSPPKPIAYRLVMPLVGGFALSAALLFITLGVRPDIMAALGTWRFDLKLGGSFILAMAAGWIALRLTRPTTRFLSVMPILIVPALLLFVAVAAMSLLRFRPRLGHPSRWERWGDVPCEHHGVFSDFFW